MGAYDRADTIQSLSAFRYYYPVSLNKEEFYNLVFLSIPAIELIAPPCDRRLQQVAKRSSGARCKRLSPNWDLAEITCRTNKFLAESSPKDLLPLVLRDTLMNFRQGDKPRDLL